MPLFFLVALVTVLVDQASKAWVRAAHLVDGSRIEVITGWMHLEHVANRGAAWGAFSGQRFLLIAFSAVAVIVVIAFARTVVRANRLAALGLGLILGGAFGNLIDRSLFGSVTDFFDLDTSVQFLHNFPVFNVADSALTVGGILTALAVLLASRHTNAASSLDS